MSRGARKTESDQQQRAAAALGLAYAALECSSAVLRLLKSHPPEEIWAARGSAALHGLGLGKLPAEHFASIRRGQRSTEQLLEALAAFRAAGIGFVPFGDPRYPPQLTDLSHPPAGLFAKGDLERLDDLLLTPRVTIVGTRRATAYGVRAAREFAAAFASRGMAVISGMALGIDGRSHEAALEARGLTMAVLGCGVDIVYPPLHSELYGRIVGKGLVMSELPPGTGPSKWTFPNRNRLLAALGDALLVVEGGVTSGAMQTAEQAAQLGRPVFALPGSIYADGHRGCNLLIRDGATPAVDVEATVEEFLLQTRIERGERRPPQPEGGEGRYFQDPLTALAAAGREAILEALDDRAHSVDALVMRTGMAARRLTAALAELELAGLVTRAGPGLYIRAP